jgi:hypothetical protein
MSNPQMQGAGYKNKPSSIQPASNKFIDSLQEYANSFTSPYHAMYGAFLVLLIAYSAQVPKEYRVFADSMLGRVLAVSVIYGVTQTLGWVYGILTATAFLLILCTSPRVMTEGFNGGMSSKETVGSKWFVERVLGENPQTIQTDGVVTLPISSN